MTRDVGARPTKLVCTIGPASVEQVGALVEAGMDVARVNWSHGTRASRAAAVRAVRAASAAAGRPIPVLGDLPGPKIRLGPLTGDEIRLETGDRFELRPGGRGAGDRYGAPVTYPALGLDVRPGDHVFLADGAVELIVAATGEAVVTEVLRGGPVRSRQGVSIPSDRLSIPAVTPTDRDLVPELLAVGVDLVGQSFVRSADDVRALRTILGPDGPPVVAKVETRAAVDGIDAILDVADAVMIARGDLGVEIPFEDVPLIQKDLVRRAGQRAVPSIVATQMLESMTSAPRPTRAEASDVANAVLDGADAIMLSGETAIGTYPVLAASAAARIAERSTGPRASGWGHVPAAAAVSPGASDWADTLALAAAAVELARSGAGIAALVCHTRTGRTARALAQGRPGVPIVAVTADPHVVATLALVHGVLPHLGSAPFDPGTGDGGDPALDATLEAIVSDAGPGSGVVVVASASDGPASSAHQRLELRRPAR